MRKFLLYSSALVLLCGVANAACIQTPTCSSLGYTSTASCTGGVKCPFGNYWNCTVVDKITELEKIIENIQQSTSSGDLSNCQDGDILYSDKTCSSDVISGKTPIGVVFDHSRNLAIALEEAEKAWATSNFSIPGINYVPYNSNSDNELYVVANMQGKLATSTSLAYCKVNGFSCPAFEYVNSYKTEGTNTGDWYLPAMGELYTLFGNMSVLNAVLKKIDGAELINGRYWSSLQSSGSYAWYYTMYESFCDAGSDENAETNKTRPIINFREWAKGDSGGDVSSSPTCNVGDIFYSDKTCSANVVSGKTPIGVVFNKENRKIIALETSVTTWSPNSYSAGIENISDQTQALQSFCGIENMTDVISYGISDYPAFQYVYNYTTDGTKVGDWYLPALGELNEIYQNKAIIDKTLSALGKSTIPTSTHWSSSGRYDSSAWTLLFDSGNVSSSSKDISYYVRPTLAY